MSERKKSESSVDSPESRRQLLERERYFLTLQSALDAVMTIDEHGKVLEWNPQAEHIFGWSKRDAEGRNLASLIIPSQFRDAHRKGMDRFLATGEPVMANRRIETVALRKDGEEFPVELTVCPIKQSGTWLFSAFVRDLGERKKLESSVRSMTTRLACLIENFHGGVLVESENRKVVLANQELFDLFRLPGSPKDLVEVDCGAAAEGVKSLFADPDGFIRGIEQTLENQVPVKEHELELADGRFLERSYVPVFDAEKYIGHMWQYRDVSVRKQSEIRLHASHEAIKLVHDGMLSILSQLREGTVILDEKRKVVFMSESATRMLSLGQKSVVGQSWGVAIAIKEKDLRIL
ncbi:MAG: PAS domain S-box protein, partial [Candidatus Latescibacterota bacterium]